MKAVATGFLLTALAVYVLARQAESAGAPAWVGYVRAAAEAGVVGALADWFAVTALFRRPLGLPIPHTAIVPTRKDALAANLQQFVADNFLSEPVVRDRLRRARPVDRVAGWLSEPANAARVTAELGSVVRALLVVLRDEDFQRVLDQTIVKRFAEWPVAPPLGRLLEQVVLDRAHHRLLDLALDETAVWLATNRGAAEGIVLAQAPTWSPRFVDRRIAAKVVAEVTRFVADVRAQPEHRVRHALDSFLLDLSKDMREDPRTIAQTEQVKQRVLDHPDIRGALADLGTTARRLLLEAVDDPDSELRRRITEGVASLGTRVSEDAELRQKVASWVEDAVTHVVTTYRSELTTVITDTVNRWDATETSRKIELAVGRDLQYIRINGTVVGAGAGLVIHTVSTVLL